MDLEPAETWKRSRLVPNISRLLVGDKEELPLKGFQASVRIDGFRARVLIDLLYLNDRGRQLEGNFQLRLPDGSSPNFFAFGEASGAPSQVAGAGAAFQLTLDASRKLGLEPREVLEARASAWSSVKAARMVPRERAAHAYRETVRRAIDPALLEWSGAGIFSARVFPLRPEKIERVVIGYDMDLIRSGDDLEFRLDLPQGTPGCAADLSAAEIEGVFFEVSPGAEPAREGGRIAWRFQDPAERSVTLRMKAPGALLISGEDPRTGMYFAARIRPEIHGSDAAPFSPKAVFLVDTSLSSNPEKFNVWIQLLGGILKENRETLREFAVLFFNIETWWWREGFSANTPESAKALLDDMENLALEGATDLGTALKEAARPKWIGKGPDGEGFDLFLLSDGSSTWGEGDASALRAGPSGGCCALFAYTTGLGGTDREALDRLARASGGAVFSVTGEGDIEKAATAHRARPWRLAGLSIKGGDDLLIAGRPESIYPGQELLLVGRGSPKAGVEAVLTLRRAGEEKAVRTRIERALSSELAPRAYGQAALGQLEEFREATEPVSKAYATHFRVTGRTCSLLMLESEQDYLRFDIEPEENAFVVKSSPASAAVEKALKRIGDSHRDPKAAFMAWMDRLESMSGLQLRVETALRVALDAMPRSSFEVAPSPLAARVRSRSQVPGRFQEKLYSDEIDYDAISSEALRRLREDGPADALKALSSLVESRPGDGALARDVAFSAMEWGLGGQAYHLLRRAAFARPFEPETYRAMAGCLEDLKDADLAMAYFELGLAARWSTRFGEFRRILGLDYIRFLRRIEKGEISASAPDFAKARIRTLGPEFDPGMMDLIVTIAWSTDGTDIDLHVVEPSGEVCYYRHRDTRIGGRLTQDVTQGYGPEMYLLKKATPGKYRFLAHYYTSDQNRSSARTKVYATVIEGWGTPREKVLRKTATLANGKEMHEIAAIVIEG